MTSEPVAERLRAGWRNNKSIESDAMPDRARAEALVRYIEAWMEANLSDEIRVEDLAEVVNRGPRTVQYAFRRSRDYTPMQALIKRRLERARRALLDADPRVTVTEVATACGFWHLSRFARRYRERFAEAPSETLARGRKARKGAESYPSG